LRPKDLSALLLTITLSGSEFDEDSIFGASRKSGSAVLCADKETGWKNVANSTMAEEENNFFIFKGFIVVIYFVRARYCSVKVCSRRSVS
jgi:hypothetical protein